jgi:D-glycero-alpha-D-manno-heptose-7-phosphate kinase
LKEDRGVEIHHDGDIPARSGMGSSSSFTVGLLNALYALQGRMMSKHSLATESIHLEQNILREIVGSQDQVLAAYGGFNHIQFLSNGEISVHPMTVAPDTVADLNAHLMLFYSGIKRTASTVAETYVNGIDEKERQMRILKDLVDESISILNSGRNIAAFGALLHQAWEAKRSLSATVSNSDIDEMYREARSAGAIGGKLIGAGGGGFLLLFVPPERQPAVRGRLANLLHVPFNFEFAGSQIIFFDREQDYSAAEKARDNQKLQPFRELTGEEPAWAKRGARR